MSKKNNVMFLIAIMCTNIMVIGESALTPVYYMYYVLFPDNMAIANTLVSGPQLVIIFASIAATALMKKFSKKSIMVAGAILFAGSGIAAAFSTSASYMILMRMLFGAGTSLVNVSAVAILADEYTDELAYGKIMGIYNAVMAAVGAVFSAIAGQLAVKDWTSVFKLFYIAIPAVIMFLVFIPRSEKTGQEDAMSQESSKKEPYGTTFWITVVDFFFYNICYAFMMFLCSSYVTENSLGNEAYIGIISSIGTIGSFLFCLAFGKLFEKMQKNFILLNYGTGIACLMALYLFPHPMLLPVVALFFGATYGSSLSYAYAYTAMVIPKSRIDSSIGILVAVFSLACFLSTYFYTFVMTLMGSEKVTSALPAAAAIAVAIFIAEIALGLKQKANAGTAPK